MALLTGRYAAEVAGVRSCYGRAVIMGTLPGVCFAEGRAPGLRTRGLRLLDYPRSVEPLREGIREDAERLAREDGLEIGSIRSAHAFREGDRIRALLAQRGDRPGPVHIFAAMGPGPAFAPWHDKASGKTTLRHKRGPVTGQVRAGPGDHLGWAGARGILAAALVLPIALVNSGLWRVTSAVHDTFVEEIGWPDLVDRVAAVYATLPPSERSDAAILAGNYGEAGAIDLYGPGLGLPPAISGADSYWQRGYGDPAPRTVIVVGFPADEAATYFARCAVAGQVTNRDAVANEETTFYRDILVCRNPRQPWPLLWARLRSFN